MPLENILVFDFEATCTENQNKDLKIMVLPPSLLAQEIIEFPLIILSMKDNSVINIFHHYIKPIVHPKLTEFCTGLTGIE